MTSPRRPAPLTRRAVLLLPCLAACGFSPVYGPGGAARGLSGQIRVEDPETRNEFSFVARMEERLGRAQAAPYALAYSIATRSEGVGVTPEQETTRFNLKGTAQYRLTELASGAELTRGSVETFTGYSATSLIVSTQTVERDANDRLMIALADQVVARLLATAEDWRA